MNASSDMDLTVHPKNKSRLAFRLLFNGGRYRLLKALRLPGRIQALSIEVTQRCICQCIMCNIWKNAPAVPEKDMAAWSGLLADPIFAELVELDITGGEPFLRNDLPVFFEHIRKLKRRPLRRLQSIAITTNALLSKRVLRDTEAILKILDGTEIHLVIACAMDGLGDRHDHIRNHPGAYVKMRASLSGLMKLRRRFPNLILGIKTTIVPENVDQLHEVRHFAECNSLFAIISPRIITTGRYRNQDRSKALTFDDRQIQQMIAFFNQGDLEWRHHAQTLAKYLRTGRIRKKCTCGLNYAFIRSTGALHLCPLLPISLGSVWESDFKDLWYSAAAKRLRGKIGQTRFCRHCTEPGLERYSLFFEGWAYLKLMVQLGWQGFEHLHASLGLDNYL